MSIELVLVVVVMLANKLGINSNNSSISPSKDKNREKLPKEKSDKKVGGQKGRVGKTLAQTDTPDEVKVILVDRDFIPQGGYREVGFQNVKSLTLIFVVSSKNNQYTQCENSLCKAHHIRELERAWEQDGMQWAKDMQELLKTINKHQTDNPDIDEQIKAQYLAQYERILAQGDEECPPPDKSNRIKGQRGRQKRTKSRALLERLRDYQDDVLRFMTHLAVPFTNNQGENDIKMTKVHQKISGCFRSMQGAQMFCLIRSYISTCRKQSVSASHALELLYKNQLPYIFIEDETE